MATLKPLPNLVTQNEKAIWENFKRLNLDIAGIVSTLTPIVPAAPTASVGLVAVPGVALTYMSSDAAPPLDQGVAPTWTGAHTFANSIQLQNANPIYFGGTNPGNALASVYYMTDETNALVLDSSSVKALHDFGVDGNAQFYGAVVGYSNLTVLGDSFLEDATLSSLAGTGTRLVTSTAAGLLGNATTIAGTYTWSGATSFSSTLAVTGILTASSRLNVGGATDNASFPLNVAGGAIAVNGTNGVHAYGSGNPGDANFERITMIHTGSSAELRSVSGGTGAAEPLRLVVGGTTRYEITNAGAHSITGAVSMSSTLAITGAATFSSTLDVASSVEGEEYFANSSGGGFWIGPTGNRSTGMYLGAGFLYLKHGGVDCLSVNGSGLPTFLTTVSMAGDLGVSGAITASSIGVSGAISASSISLGGNESFTYDEGTFTATGNGFSGSVTGTARFVRFGKAVVLYLPQLQGTSNTTAFTVTGLPASIQPARTQWTPVSGIVDNTTTEFHGTANVTGGTIDFYRKTSASGLEPNTYTSSGTKGIYAMTITYSLA